MGKTIEIPIELADCIKCGKELPNFIEKMAEKQGSINKACQYVERVTEGAIKAETARKAYGRNNKAGTFVPTPSGGKCAKVLESSNRESQKSDNNKVLPLAPKACCTPKFVEWQPVESGCGWYGGRASNKVRGRCNDLHTKFTSLNLEMIKFFRNDASARSEKLSRDDWARIYEETNHFAGWLIDVSQEMKKAAGINSVSKKETCNEY